MSWMRNLGDELSRSFSSPSDAFSGEGLARLGRRAADAALGPLDTLVGLSVSAGARAVRSVSTTLPARWALDAGLDRLNGNGHAAEPLFDADRRRESFVAVATDSGAQAVRETFALAAAVARLAFADTRRLKQTIEDGLEEMRRLADSADMQELLPVPILSESLTARARTVADAAPERFLEVLGRDEPAGTPGLGEILSAALADAGNLRVFFTGYPRIMALLGVDVGRLVVAGSLSFSEIEAFMEGRRIA